MPFPDKPKVRYRKNPLDRVVCQLRFPPILKIDSGLPADFQEQIRQEFQNFSEKTELKIEVPAKLAPPETWPQLVQPTATKNYEFSSEDGIWKINLTRSFIALSTNQYTRWQDFRDKLSLPLQALMENYAPTHFSRIGLRYIDVIKRSKFNLQNAAWKDLFQPHILGLLGAEEVANSIPSFESQYDINLTDGQGSVRIITRFVEAKDNGELSYMIDSDFSNSTKTEHRRVLEQLDQFSMRGARLFQWCITEKLHQAMEPEAL